jgi:leader peptidase (prepilin peptidase)/N-methyltransferase
MDPLLSNPYTLYPLTFVFGLMVGSFLNVVVYRLPRILERQWHQECAELTGRPAAAPQGPILGLARPGSHCPHCGHHIRPWENIPLLSYAILRGKCSACQAPIDPRYPATELLGGLIALMVIGHFGPTPAGAAALVLSWGLLALSLIDYDTKLLPDLITLPLLWLGLLLSLGGLFADPVSAILGAAGGYLALWIVYKLFKTITGKEGMGYGDFKLLALLGAWLGWQYLPQIIILSALVGAVAGTLMILAFGRERDLPIPYGPYLATAGWVSLLWGDTINRAYLLWAGLT